MRDGAAKLGTCGAARKWQAERYNGASKDANVEYKIQEYRKMKSSKPSTLFLGFVELFGAKNGLVSRTHVAFQREVQLSIDLLRFLLVTVQRFAMANRWRSQCLPSPDDYDKFADPRGIQDLVGLGESPNPELVQGCT